jgi:hypothetical protein
VVVAAEVRMVKQVARKGSTVSVRVPSYVRSRLFPYAAVFEDVVVPIARRVRAQPSQRLRVELRESVEAALVAAVKFVPHPSLMRCGLMLCCYHAFQRAGDRERTALGRAYHLLRESFDHYGLEDSQVFL